ncbi:MAG: ribosome biogenesis GTPase Der [Mycoplasmoidaceae bacterium]|nr:MAG: ribosome biogenesis GTPase Der [Mycoplasmoidaceae bacterium]
MLKVALVGKPNVGKSTIFNRLTKTRKAITLEESGTTRDRIKENVLWLNRTFVLYDTGGLTNSDAPFQKAIDLQVKYAIEECDLILFVVSNKDGIDPMDTYVSKLLKKNKNKKVILVCNKCENPNLNFESSIYSLGWGKPMMISAEHGIGVGDLLDKVIQNDTKGFSEEEKSTSFCIIGRTNVGKSTLMNCILGKERVVTSPIEHTTRDAIDEDFLYNKEKYTIIDTAGIRRKGHVKEAAEKLAVLRTEQSIKRSDIILLVLDGSADFNEQDESIGGLAYDANIPTIIVVNKWDKVQKESLTMSRMEKLIRSKFAYLSWAPIIFISALDNRRVHTIFETIKTIKKQALIKVATGLLNTVIAKATINNPPPKFKGGRMNIGFATQIKSQIPTFVLFCNNPNFLHFSFSRYIENQIREAFGINWVPITVYYKDKNARIRNSEPE